MPKNNLQKQISKIESQIQDFDFPSEEAGRVALIAIQGEIDLMNAQLGVYRSDLTSAEWREWRARLLMAKAHKTNEVRAIKAWLRNNLGKIDAATTDNATLLLYQAYQALRTHVAFAELDEDEQMLIDEMHDYLCQALGTTNLITKKTK